MASAATSRGNRNVMVENRIVRLGRIRLGLWILFLALSTAGFSGCGPAADLPAARGTEADGGTQVLSAVRLRETSERGLEWILEARQATRSSGSTAARMESLRVEFYQGGNELRSTMVADSGRVDSKRGLLVAQGHVIVVTPEGNRLETEELTWDRLNARVSSEQFVRLTRGKDLLTGIGFTSDPNLESYRILKDVRASVREEGPIGDEIRDADDRP